jgi:hypothetical protein
VQELVRFSLISELPLRFSQLDFLAFFRSSSMQEVEIIIRIEQPERIAVSQVPTEPRQNGGLRSVGLLTSRREDSALTLCAHECTLVVRTSEVSHEYNAS